ncbi:hypothetical protein D9615_003724 [Tricholomella constricta]|uniref:ATP-dependent DNA helicase PIF1 n=1 Tax=Tricholomella constricta TaxID=117010 RepID=A0A8H5HHS9_9AGAR|nr:hypothetical protein D9615_003724 [Tricholomella constricta]
MCSATRSRSRLLLARQAALYPAPFRIGSVVGFHSSTRRQSEAPKSPFQTFVEVLRDELRKNRELQDNVKQLQGDVDKFQDSEAMKKAKAAYERARLTSSIKENPKLRAAADELMKTGVKVGDAVSEALKTMEESELMRAISKASAAVSSTIEKSTEPIRKTAAYKTLSETLVDALDDSGSAKHAGFEEKEARRLRRQKRLAKAGKGDGLGPAGKRVVADPEAGQAVVLHKDSPRQEKWNRLKETNPVLRSFVELRQAFDESENAFVATMRSVTQSIGTFFDENETAQVMRLMKAFDPEFNRESFERELREYIVPEVVDAYLSADKEALRSWCGEAFIKLLIWNIQTYNVLWATMEHYLRQGLISDSKVLDIRQVDVSDGKILEDDVPVFLVQFSTQEVLMFRNAKTGEIAVGADNKVEQCTYIAAITRVEEELTNELTGGWKVVETQTRPPTMSKTAQSGLRTIKRDFSASSMSQSSDIEWLPTPPKPESGPPKLTGAQKRLKDIQDALLGKAPPAPRGVALIDSKAINKRTSPVSHDAPVPKKPRQLPPSWRDNDPLTAPSFPASSFRSTSMLTSTVTRSVAPASSSGSAAPARKSKVAAVFLSQEQTQILKLVSEGQSVFYTGSAGTGKSVLLREIIKTLRKKYVKAPDAVAITASTGIAACNIGGVTIHSFAGIGLGIESADDLASKIRKNKKASARWLRTKVLIVDEVSMVDGDLFDKLARIGSILRKKVEPFGGIQVIVTGDFFQLPPVGKHGAQVKFAFEASLWKETVKHTYNLTKVFRQSDQEFIDMLNEMRFGRLTPKSIAKFRSLSREIDYDDGLAATELFPRREDVDRSNTSRISRLQTHQERYTSIDGGTIQDENQKQKMLANFMAPRDLSLRIDAQVMLIKNVDETLVNGSMGRVVRFVDPAVYGTELDADGAQTLPGEVAVIGNNATVGSAAKKGAVARAGQVKLYPVVEFVVPNGGRRLYLVMPEVWKVELPNGEVQVMRTQGQTLDRVRVDLGKVFEKGQAYVALSRATSLEGLQVLNFDPSKVNAHPKVAVWSKTLETVEE